MAAQNLTPPAGFALSHFDEGTEAALSHYDDSAFVPLHLPPAPQEQEHQELMRRALAASSLLARHKAERHQALIIHQPKRRHYVIGTPAPCDVDAQEDLARALHVSTRALSFEQLDPMVFEVLFRHVYDGPQAQEYETKAAARRSVVWRKVVDPADDTEQAPTIDATPEDSGVIDLTDAEEYARNSSRQEAELSTREFVRLALMEFVQAGGSDLHAEASDESGGCIRFRCDGVLFARWTGIPPTRAREINAALAQMARVEASRMKFVRQDSIIKLRVLKKGQPANVELRFTSAPAIPWPEVVLRSQSEVIDDLNRVGLFDFQLHALKEAYTQPQGIILVTGPTGSGKTNTLEGLFRVLQSTDDRKLIEIGDPIEILSPHRTQIPVTKTNSWLDAFHSCMRQDPDIIALGELRGVEPVQVALDAALTGHLVLATFHTSDCETTFTRLFKMGIPRDLLADALNAIHAQRLVRVLCDECCRVDEIHSQGLGVTIYEAQGCPLCFGTGYKGRTAVAEVLPINNAVKDWIRDGMPAPDIVRQAIAQGWMCPMKRSAALKLKAGLTSFREVQRVMSLAADGSKASAWRKPYSGTPSQTENAGGMPAVEDFIDAEWTTVE